MKFLLSKFQSSSYSESCTYHFFDSNCHKYTEHFTHNGQSNYREIIEFVAAIFKTDNLVLEKHWKVTDLNAPPPTTRTREEPTILESYFENEDGEKIERTKYRQTVYLIVKSKDMVGKSIDIDLSDLEGDYKYNGTVLNEKEIKNHTVTADKMKIELNGVKIKK